MSVYLCSCPSKGIVCVSVLLQVAQTLCFEPVSVSVVSLSIIQSPYECQRALIVSVLVVLQTLHVMVFVPLVVHVAFVVITDQLWLQAPSLASPDGVTISSGTSLPKTSHAYSG